MESGSSLEHHEVSHVGRRRANNQDSKGVVEPWNREQFRRRGWLFIVADGMGAHAAGEMASAIAVQEVTSTYEKWAARSPPLALRSSIEDANGKIHAKGETSPDLKGMGTTCTVLVLVPRGAIVGHVGDSRAYRVRADTIEQLTRDHSLVWEIEAKVGGHDAVLPGVVPKNIITRSMGPHAEVRVDLEGPFPVETDDVFVLCSDGLSGQVADEEIGVLAAGLPTKTAAEALVGLALARGAPDNVTVIVVRTGPKERSKKPTAGDVPWVLSEPKPDAERKTVPWRLLAVAAASLLGGLLSYPEGDVMRRLLDDPSLRGAIGWSLFGLLSLTFLGALLAAVLGFLGTTVAPDHILQPGRLLGTGPYRKYDCRPTRELIEGIAASVESAADGLEAAAQGECVAPLARARSAAGSGDFAAALSATAEALAAFTRFVGPGADA